ncbi:hypothetical protein FQN54_001275 [Arachnomyces sp. PD_36]|nr:hypothetical protein FQN54_001275 [Arachnomyces sp. PD_36]
MAASKEDLSRWDGFNWRRQMERFGENDESLTAVGPEGESQGICALGELTDRGRQTTMALGRRLRHLYVDQLGYMPKIISNTDDMYLRATPIPRALDSMQEALWGMYPPEARTASFPPPVIVSRSLPEETLFPNEGNCRRFRQLSAQFAKRAADKWNDSEKMGYLNSLWSKWMPPASPNVAVDSHPRLSGILDTVNSTLAHGPETRLPSEFYDKKAIDIASEIAVDEWFTGYKESQEYRKLGMGAQVGDVVDRMVAVSLEGAWRNTSLPIDEANHGKPIKFALNGCHDTSLAGILASLGAFDGGKWPPYTSSIAIELFEKVSGADMEPGKILEEFQDPNSPPTMAKRPSEFFRFLLGRSGPSSNGNNKDNTTPEAPASRVARIPLSSLPASSREKLRTKHYVRIRYNDHPVQIPGCAAKPGNHLPGDPTFCTLEAFKEITDKFTPGRWRDDCAANTGEGMFGKNDVEKVPAGY